MKLSPLDSWWRNNFNTPYGSALHRGSSPIYQMLDYIEYIDAIAYEYKDKIDAHKKEHVSDQEAFDFISNLEGAEALKDLASKELLNK